MPRRQPLRFARELSRLEEPRERGRSCAEEKAHGRRLDDWGAECNATNQAEDLLQVIQERAGAHCGRVGDHEVCVPQCPHWIPAIFAPATAGVRRAMSVRHLMIRWDRVPLSHPQDPWSSCVQVGGRLDAWTRGTQFEPNEPEGTLRGTNGEVTLASGDRPGSLTSPHQMAQGQPLQRVSCSAERQWQMCML